MRAIVPVLVLAVAMSIAIASAPGTASPGYLKIIQPEDGAVLDSGKVVIKWVYEGPLPHHYSVIVDSRAFVINDPYARSFAVNVPDGVHRVSVFAYGKGGSWGFPLLGFDTVSFKVVSGQGGLRLPPLHPGVRLPIVF